MQFFVSGLQVAVGLIALMRLPLYAVSAARHCPDIHGVLDIKNEEDSSVHCGNGLSKCNSLELVLIVVGIINIWFATIDVVVATPLW